MTKQELTRLRFLKKEIAENQRQLRELENAAYQCTAPPTNTPAVGGYADKSGNLAASIADKKDVLAQQIQQAWDEYERLSRYIASVEDPQMRLILALRYVDGLTWRQTALQIGGKNTADGVRKKHDRFLKLSVLSALPVI